MKKVENYDETVMRDLRKLNFDELISVGVPKVESYTFDEYKNNGHEHKPINGYCISCEEKGCHISEKNVSYKLTNISHGAHSSDFLRALKDVKSTKYWHQQPILFVYESPSLDYRIYKEVAYKGHKKHPAKQWYWIHGDKENVCFPDKFKGREYSNFILSVINTFELANVYTTNLVKCGMNNDEGKFKGLSFYKKETIQNCYDNYLKREISIIKPEIIFAVGAAVEKKVKQFVGKSYYVQQLPHPAARIFRKEHRKVVYFWDIARALHKAGIIDTNEGADLARMYLEKY